MYVKSFGKSTSVEQNRLQGVATRKEVDRDGEVVLPAGGDFAAFLQNPVVLWAHDHRRPPIGKVVRLEADENEARFTLEFATTQFARDIYALYHEGILNAFSIGFMPKEGGVSQEKVLPGQTGATYKAWELLELSAVPVPSCRSALVRRDASQSHLVIPHLIPVVLDLERGLIELEHGREKAIAALVESVFARR